MGQEGNIYQDSRQEIKQENPIITETPTNESREVPLVSMTSNNLRLDEQEAVNKLISMGVILLFVALIITVFYLFSVSSIFTRLFVGLGNIEFPF